MAGLQQEAVDTSEADKAEEETAASVPDERTNTSNEPEQNVENTVGSKEIDQEEVNKFEQEKEKLQEDLDKIEDEIDYLTNIIRRTDNAKKKKWLEEKVDKLLAETQETLGAIKQIDEILADVRQEAVIEEAITNEAELAQDEDAGPVPDESTIASNEKGQNVVDTMGVTDEVPTSEAKKAEETATAPVPVEGTKASSEQAQTAVDTADIPEDVQLDTDEVPTSEAENEAEETATAPVPDEGTDASSEQAQTEVDTADVPEDVPLVTEEILTSETENKAEETATASVPEETTTASSEQAQKAVDTTTVPENLQLDPVKKAEGTSGPVLTEGTKTLSQLDQKTLAASSTLTPQDQKALEAKQLAMKQAQGNVIKPASQSPNAYWYQAAEEAPLQLVLRAYNGESKSSRNWDPASVKTESLEEWFTKFGNALIVEIPERLMETDVMLQAGGSCINQGPTMVTVYIDELRNKNDQITC